MMFLYLIKLIIFMESTSEVCSWTFQGALSNKMTDVYINTWQASISVKYLTDVLFTACHSDVMCNA